MIKLNHFVDGEITTTEGEKAVLLILKTGVQGMIWLDLQSPVIPPEIAKHFKLHPLELLDAQRTRHPPKVEQFSDHLFVLQRGIKQFDVDLTLSHVQIAYFVGEDFIISFHQQPSISINKWWEHDKLAQYLSQSPLLLLSRLLNTMAQNYLDTLLEFESKLSEIEDTIALSQSDDLLIETMAYRSRLRKLRRIFSYHEKNSLELLKIVKDKAGLGEHQYNFQDVYDKNERLHSLSNMFYELTGDLVEGFLSMASHRLNKTMQVLTVITAIFVPLGFLAGLYGMNFQYMPELQFHNGYFVLLSVMGVLAVSLIGLFKFKRWL